MAKGKTSLRDTMKLTKKVPIKKTAITETDIEATEKQVSKIHSTQGKVKRVTIDIPLELHAAIKMKTFKAGITMKRYILDLARIDLGMEE